MENTTAGIIAGTGVLGVAGGVGVGGLGWVGNSPIATLAGVSVAGLSLIPLAGGVYKLASNYSKNNTTMDTDNVRTPQSSTRPNTHPNTQPGLIQPTQTTGENNIPDWQNFGYENENDYQAALAADQEREAWRNRNRRIPQDNSATDEKAKTSGSETDSQIEFFDQSESDEPQPVLDAETLLDSETFRSMRGNLRDEVRGRKQRPDAQEPKISAHQPGINNERNVPPLSPEIEEIVSYPISPTGNNNASASHQREDRGFGREITPEEPNTSVFRPARI